MNKNFDIVIVGSGLTGNTCSLTLAKAGYNVALIDPYPFAEACKNNNAATSKKTEAEYKSWFVLIPIVYHHW